MSLPDTLRSSHREYLNSLGIPDWVLNEMGVISDSEHYVRYPIRARDGGPYWRYRVIGNNLARRFYWDPGVKGGELLYTPRKFKTAIQEANGIVYIVNGESAVWAFMAGGVHNVVCWFGEASIPSDLLNRLRDAGVQQIKVLPDLDDAGAKFAARLQSVCDSEQIAIQVLHWGSGLSAGYDGRDFWLTCDQDPTLFQSSLESLYPQVSISTDFTYPPEVKLAIAQMIGADASTASENGWCKESKCIFHDDSDPSASFNITSGTLHCYAGCGSNDIVKVANAINFDLKPYRNKAKSERQRSQKSRVSHFKELGFETSITTGRPIKSSLKNAKIALHGLSEEIQCRWEVYTRRPALTINGTGFWSIANEHMVITVKDMIMARFGAEISNKEIWEAIILAAKENLYEPIMAHIESLPKWDGISRSLVDYLGLDKGPEYDELDEQLDKEICEILIRGMLARAHRPGCKFDYCIIFVGEQGIHKSTFFETLATTDLYGSDTGLARADARKPIEKALGKWLLEDAEFAESGIAALQSRVKARITSATEQDRMAYERYPEEFRKRHVLVATTNHRRFIADTTGGRRYFLLFVSSVDLPKFQEDRDQVIAEQLVQEKWKDEQHLQLHGSLLERMTERQRAAQLQNGIQDVIEDWMDRIDVQISRASWILNKELNEYLSEKVGYRIKVQSEYRQVQDTMTRLKFHMTRRLVEGQQGKKRVWIRGNIPSELPEDMKLIVPLLTEGGYEVDFMPTKQHEDNGLQQQEIDILDQPDKFDWTKFD